MFISTIIWIGITHASLKFSLNLAIYMSEAGRKTFIPAHYDYNEQFTFFDNTFWTYGTDYILGLLMLFGAYKCYYAGTSRCNEQKNTSLAPSSKQNASQCKTMMANDTNLEHHVKPMHLRRKSAALFISYAISVFAGGYAHQTYLTLESMNTTSFRVIWTICVGSVTMAGGFMGMIGTEMGRNFLHSSAVCDDSRYSPPIIPDYLWYIYGAYMTLVCALGGISYMRPACDIFVAGTTQFIPTMYCELMLLSARWKQSCPKEVKQKVESAVSDTIICVVPKMYRYSYIIGFILNAPLLPSYPLFVQYTQLPLGIVNALLHTNLTFAWGMQSVGLYRICAALTHSKGSSSEHCRGNVKSE